jgi:hypothetical protein
MQLRNAVVGALLSLALCCASGAARAGDPALDQDVAAAETAYGALSFDEANRRAEVIVKRRGLTHDQLVRSYRVLALSRGAMGDDEKAREAFVQLLTFDPDHKVDKSLGPKVQQPFLEAKGFWRNQLQKPGVDATIGALRQGTAATLRIVTRDPTHVVKTVSVGWRFGASAPFETASVTTGEQAVPIRQPTANESRLDYYVQALDASDSVVFEAGSPQTPRTALIELTPSSRPANGSVGEPSGGGSSSVFSSPLFWVATAIVVGGGATGAYLLATRDPEQRSLPPTSANVAPILFCGTERCR